MANAVEPRLAEYQLTKEEAVEFADNRRWEKMTAKERGLFQLRQDRLCMPFNKVHEGITELLGRSVWTHEFAKPDALWREYLGLDEKPTLEDILDKLPPRLRDNMIVIGTGRG